MRELFLFLCLLIGLDLRAQKSVASYDQVYDKNSEGKPSRCDCDYRKQSLVLYDDSSFIYENVKGRLDPEVQLSEKGTWNIENDTVLILTVRFTEYPFMSGLEPKHKNDPYRKSYIIHRNGIRHFDEELEGHGLPYKPKK